MGIALGVLCKKGVGHVRVGEKRTTLLGALTVVGFSRSTPNGEGVVSVAFDNSRQARIPSTGFTVGVEDAISLAVALIHAAFNESDTISDIEILTRVGAVLGGADGKQDTAV